MQEELEVEGLKKDDDINIENTDEDSLVEGNHVPGRRRSMTANGVTTTNGHANGTLPAATKTVTPKKHAEFIHISGAHIEMMRSFI